MSLPYREKPGIPISTGFNLTANTPLDNRLVVNSYDEMMAIPDVKQYIGMYVYVIENDLQYRLTASRGWIVDSFGFLYGKIDPKPSDGNEGFMYINTESGVLYKKIYNTDTKNEEWIDLIEVKGGGTGAKGDKGDTGARGSIWYSGTKITGGSTVTDQIFSESGITNALVQDCYLNIVTSDIYQCTASGGSVQAKWSYLCNIEGAGIRGSLWYKGTVMTDTTDEEVIYADSGIDSALPNDIYLNIVTCDTYICTVGGNAATAKWKHDGNLRINEISIQKEQPTDPNVKLWVKISGDSDIIPMIKDNEISDSDTWSSKKIDESFKSILDQSYTNSKVSEVKTIRQALNTIIDKLYPGS